MHGAADQSYTAGVVCAKVARYAERIHHKDRLTQPLRRTGPKGSGQFAPISWDDALDIVAENFLKNEREFGAESIWPYHYAGTMGLVMRDGIKRLTHVKRYSGFYSSICINPAWSGFLAGTGKMMGPDPREMAKADCVVIWGTNAVSTQVNVMTHAMRARKERGAKIVVVDIYRNDTMKQADLALCLRPGTDGALACAVMHVLFRDRPRRPRLSRALHRRARGTGGASGDARSAMGERDHRPAGRRNRSFRRSGRRAQAHLFPSRLWLFAPAQRRRQYARGVLHRRRHRRLGP